MKQCKAVFEDGSRCNRVFYSKGFCAPCYERMRTRGTVEPYRPAYESDCEFDGCIKPQYSRGLCTGHYQQQKLGKELTPLRPMHHRAPVIDGMKWCRDCDRFKPLYEYSASGQTKAGKPKYRAQCGPCWAAYLRARRVATV